MNSDIDSQREKLKGDEFETQCLMHAETGDACVIISTPGTGKTEKSAGLAQRSELKSIMGYSDGDDIPAVVVPCQQAPEEAIRGIPYKHILPDGSTTLQWVLPPDFTEKPMLLILDEINRAKGHVRDAMFPLLTGHRMINGFRMHPKSLVILLGNDPSHCAGAKEMDSALHLRTGGGYDWEPTVPDWITNFAEPRRLDPAIPAYLRSFPEKLCQFNPNAPIQNQPCPRTWEMVAKTWALTHYTETQRAKKIRACIGRFEGEQFETWVLKLRGVVPSLDTVATNPLSVAIPDGLDAPAILAQSMSQLLAQDRDDAVDLAVGAAVILTRMFDAGHVEHATKALRDAMQPMLKGRPVRLALPQVQTTLRANHGLMETVLEVGRQQSAAGAVR